ncbi:MAG: hypothetical protein IJ284_05950 [Clostridia bacterium]|nr:hypothetical protein [Clostridia bacterium]
MKKILAAVFTAITLVTLTACQFMYAVPLVAWMGLYMGTYYENNPESYAEAVKYIDEFAALPEKLEGLTVNEYAYTRYEYMDTCVELFIDLTVTEEQMAELLNKARKSNGILAERAAYYAEGYFEIVYADSYTVGEDLTRVGNAYIQKIVYNEETGNVIYEHFDAFDTGVYEVKDVAYFNRFGIDQTEYVKHTIDENNGVLV